MDYEIITQDPRWTYGERAWIRLAAYLAFGAHNGIQQVRNYAEQGKPYFAHVEAVAQLVAKYDGDYADVCAAYLHDTVEDTGITLQHLYETFPNRVGDLVWMVTDQAQPADGNRRARFEINMAHNIQADDHGQLIKGCDIYHNCLSILAPGVGFASVFVKEIEKELDLLTRMDPRVKALCRSAIQAWKTDPSKPIIPVSFT